MAVRIVAAANLVDALATDDPHAVAAAVAAIEGAPADTPELAAALFAAGRACEDKLADPAHALAIYERLLREQPDAGVATAAQRRATALRATLGDPVAARHARELAALVADVDHLPAVDVIARGDALAAADWPGAPDAALWVADWSRRTGHFADAGARYAAVIARWPRSEQAQVAARAAAGCAIDARDWDRAEALATQLPTADPADRLVRVDLLRAAHRGHLRAHLDTAAWLVLVLVVAGLAASLLDAARRGGWHRPPLTPPIELWFAAPVAAVLVGVALTAQRLIAPAVALISLVGLALAWLSGATLALLRTRGRPTRARSLAHIAACTLAVLAVAYIALARDGLLDLLVETIRFGPES